MTISERVFELASKVRQQKAGIETEEATKNAFVMPFISLVLGYDVFNPAEVIPEFTADVGVKRGEKIDYALVHGGQVQILIEAKKVNDPLRIEHSSPLFRYFAVTNARVAVLTNGEIYLHRPRRPEQDGRQAVPRPRPRRRRRDAPARTGQAHQGVLRPRLRDQCRRGIEVHRPDQACLGN